MIVFNLKLPKMLILIILVGLISLTGCKSKLSSNKPNVVIILTDDLGYGDVSKFNPKSKIQTLNIDSLADEGVWCTDAHSPSSICSPSRYAMLTGRYAWRGKLKKGITHVCDSSVIEKDLLCLPQMLKEVGYNTACIGKWHLGFDWPWKDDIVPTFKERQRNLTNDMFDWSKPIKGGPLAIGFDHYFGDDVPNFPPYAFIQDSLLTCNPVHVNPEDFKCLGVRGHFHGAGPGEEGWDISQVMPTITEKAVNYIDKKSKEDKPFFLLFSTTSPHTPVTPIADFQNSSDAGYYGDYVKQTDNAIGQVIAVLKENQIFDNTLIVVTSDNGPSPKILDIAKDYNHLPMAHLRGMKWDMWEGGHRVPFVASWPNGKVMGGKKIDKLISLTDLFATIASIVDYNIQSGSAEDSYNVLSTLTKGETVRREMVYHQGNGKLGLRKNNWVYLRGEGGRRHPQWFLEKKGIKPNNSSNQLSNLDTDIRQRVNVYEKYPDVVKEMEMELLKIESKKGKAIYN